MAISWHRSRQNGCSLCIFSNDNPVRFELSVENELEIDSFVYLEVTTNEFSETWPVINKHRVALLGGLWLDLDLNMYILQYVQIRKQHVILIVFYYGPEKLSGEIFRVVLHLKQPLRQKKTSLCFKTHFHRCPH